jgi:hypothetical protein
MHDVIHKGDESIDEIILDIFLYAVQCELCGILESGSARSEGPSEQNISHLYQCT